MRQYIGRTGDRLVAIGEASLIKAERKVAACQSCSASVHRAFESVITEVLAAEESSSEYVLGQEAHCPNCNGPLFENTLVRCEGDFAYETSGWAETLNAASCGDETNVILIDEWLLSEAQRFISGCQQCDQAAEIAFDYVLDAVTQSDPTVTEYLMRHPTKCPRCAGDVTEKTLVRIAPSAEQQEPLPADHPSVRLAHPEPLDHFFPGAGFRRQPLD